MGSMTINQALHVDVNKSDAKSSYLIIIHTILKNYVSKLTQQPQDENMFCLPENKDKIFQ